MDKRIGKIYRDSDGWWIELKPGFIVRGEWTHGIVEDTKRAALDKMYLVEPCQCDECRSLVTQTKNPHAAALGRLGGSVKSEAKAAASRENGKRGGRPRKPVPVAP